VMKTFVTLILLVLSFALPAQTLLVPVQEDGLWGYADVSGNLTIKPSYFDAGSFSEGLAPVRRRSLWGFVDRYGQEIIPPEFRRAMEFSEGLAAVFSGDAWGFIDKNGEWAIPPRFDAVSSFSDGRAVAKDDRGYFFIDRTGQVVIPRFFDDARPFSEGLAYVSHMGRAGFIDLSGNWIYHHDFDNVYSYSEGLVAIRKYRKFGFANHYGTPTIPLEFTDALYFSGGLAPVSKGDKWFYIDQSGHRVSDQEYEMAYPYKYGYAVIKDRGRFGLIDINGNVAAKPRFEKAGVPGRAISMKDEAMVMAENSLAQWQLKDQFETTDAYLQRVNNESIKTQSEQVSKTVLNRLASEYLQIEDLQLGNYFADQEFFNLYLPGMITSLIPVPLNEALWFKDNWANRRVVSADFGILGDKFVLTHILIQVGNNTYEYDYSRMGVLIPNGLPEYFDYQFAGNVPELIYTENHVRPVRPVVIPGKSDVDTEIPVNRFVQHNVFALIIGNEDYSFYNKNLDKTANVDYAAVDATIFRDYARNTLGLPEENITLLLNATAGQINQAISKLKSIAEAYEGEASFIVYYAGHGVPDAETGDPYLLPVDVSPADLSYAIKVEGMLNDLTEYESQLVTVFIDACFTGEGRNEGLMIGRGVRVKPKSPYVKGNLVVFSASEAEGASYPYQAKAHGMFTYHLLKALQQSGGRVSFGELAEYLTKEVNRRALVEHSVEQVPTVRVSKSFTDTWYDLALVPPHLY